MPGYTGSNSNKTYFKYHLQVGVVPNAKHEHVLSISYYCRQNYIPRSYCLYNLSNHDGFKKSAILIFRFFIFPA